MLWIFLKSMSLHLRGIKFQKLLYGVFSTWKMQQSVEALSTWDWKKTDVISTDA